MTTKTAEQAFTEIEKSAPDAELRICRRIEIGKAIHQGDVYCHRVDAKHPRGKALGTRQVAVGTSVGSRHVVEGESVEVFAGKKLPEWVKTPEGLREDALLGPVVVADEPFVLTHPEHAHHRMPAGVYQVTYQADLVSMRAVAD